MSPTCRDTAKSVSDICIPMQRHTRIYFDFFGYDEGDFIPSELSGDPAVDIHHISSRGMGGGKTKDHILNLMALTREEHEKFGDKKQYKEMLQKSHVGFMIAHQPRKTEIILNNFYEHYDQEQSEPVEIEQTQSA